MRNNKRTAKTSKRTPARAKTRWTVGIDLGDQWSRYSVLDEGGTPLKKSVQDNPRSLNEALHRLGVDPGCDRSGTHSLWVSEHLRQLGHEVLVANAREIRAITHSDSKSDQLDAEKLARYARDRPENSAPITYRSIEMQCSLNIIRARELVAI